MSNRYAILRVQKLKAAVAVHRSAKHNYREQTTPNADPSRTPDNTHHGPQDVAGLMQAFEARKPAKHRKDAVQCVEVLITASPEAMNAKTRGEQDAYFGQATDWLKAKFGADNVIGVSIHRDEATPHLCAYVVPVDPASGRLNAKKWLGGARALSELQTDFAQQVGQHHGLERGQEGSRATHTTVRHWYAEVNAEAAKAHWRDGQVTADDLKPQKLQPENLKERLLGVAETQEGVALRLSQVNAARIQRAKEIERKNQKMAVELSGHRLERSSLLEKVREYLELVRGLGTAELEKLAKAADQMREHVAQQRREWHEKAKRGEELLRRERAAKERQKPAPAPVPEQKPKAVLQEKQAEPKRDKGKGWSR